MPLAHVTGAEDTFVVRAASPSKFNLAVVRVRGDHLVLQVVHVRRKANSPLRQHHADALERLEHGLAAVGLFDMEAAGSLLSNLFESASSAMNADAAGRLGDGARVIVGGDSAMGGRTC